MLYKLLNLIYYFGRWPLLEPLELLPAIFLLVSSTIFSRLWRMLSWAKDWLQRNVLETSFVHVSAHFCWLVDCISEFRLPQETHNFCQLAPEKLFSFFPSLALFFASWGCVDAFRLRCHVANCATDSKSCDPMSEILSRGHLCSRHFLCLSRVCHLVQPGSESGKHALSSAGFVEDVRPGSSMEAAPCAQEWRRGRTTTTAK